jgi:hypothetical protein
VVGAPEAADGQGAVFVLAKAGRSWRLAARISDPDPRRGGDFFGYAVAISGTTIAVGAPEEDSQRGVIYVFGRSRTKANKWYLELTAPAVLQFDGPVGKAEAGHKVELTRLFHVTEQPPAAADQVRKDRQAVFVDQMEPDQ